MGHFCTKCGRPLADGEICNCQGQGENAQQVNLQKTQQENEQMNQGMNSQQNANQNVNSQQNANQNVNSQQNMQQNANQNMNQNWNATQMGNQNFGQNANMQQPSAQRVAIENVASKFLETMISMFRTPITTGRKLIQDADIVLVAVFLVLQGILSGLFGSIVLAKTLGKAVRYFSSSVKLPYIQAFFATFFASIALSVILAVILLVLHITLKKEARFKKMLAIAAIRSVWLIPAIIISMIFALMSIKVGLFCFYALEVFAIVSMITTLNTFIEAEKKEKMVVMNGILLFVFILCAVCIMTMLCKTYIPSDLSSSIFDLFGMSGYRQY